MVRLQRLDARTGRPVGVRIDLDDAPYDGRIAVTPGAVWISDPDDDTLLRIDPTTSRLERAIEIPAGVDGPLAVGEGALWVLSGDPQLAVTPVDPDSGAVGRPIRVGDPSAVAREGLAVGGGSVWVGDPETGAVRRIDPRRRRLMPTSLTLEAGVAALAYGDGALWALAGDGEVVRRIDPDAAALRGQPVRVDVARDARLAVGADAAWVTDARALPRCCGCATERTARCRGAVVTARPRRCRAVDGLRCRCRRSLRDCRGDRRHAAGVQGAAHARGRAPA